MFGKKSRKQVREEDNRVSERDGIEAFATLASVSTLGAVGHDQAFCVVIDVSENGIRLRTPQPPSAGQAVTISVALGEEVHSIEARVAWVKNLSSGHDVGFKFAPEAVASEFVAAVQECLDAQPS